jgi:hypothetical protein
MKNDKGKTVECCRFCGRDTTAKSRICGKCLGAGFNRSEQRGRKSISPQRSMDIEDAFDLDEKE